jgi:hypothetical protein
MRAWRNARAKAKELEAARAAARPQPAPEWPPRAGPVAPTYEATSGPIYGRWVEPVAAEPEVVADVPVAEAPIAAPVEPVYEQPYEPPAEHRIDIPAEHPAGKRPGIEEPIEHQPVATLRLVPTQPTTPEPAPTTDEPPAAALEPQAEFLRLLEVVTRMCDHVIDFIEADRTERRLMIETLTQLARVITEGAAATVAAASALPAPAPPTERLLGGSMEAGPDPVIDLRSVEPRPASRPRVETNLSEAPTTEIAVEVRGRFGDRWVDGFEICEVMTTPDGPRYRLRRHRDGVVLPELFDATSIRHIETFEQLGGEQLNENPGHWSRS